MKTTNSLISFAPPTVAGKPKTQKPAEKPANSAPVTVANGKDGDSNVLDLDKGLDRLTAIIAAGKIAKPGQGANLAPLLQGIVEFSEKRVFQFGSFEFTSYRDRWDERAKGWRPFLEGILTVDGHQIPCAATANQYYSEATNRLERVDENFAEFLKNRSEGTEFYLAFAWISDFSPTEKFVPGYIYLGE